MTNRAEILINRDAEVESYEGRTLVIRALSFDREYTVSDGGPAYVESYDRNAFTRSLARTNVHPLYTLHDTKRLPTGKVTFSVDGSALMATAELARSIAGEEALELVTMGVLKGASIGARAITPVKAVNGRIRRTEVALRELSLVVNAALDDAGVLAIREEQEADFEMELLKLKAKYYSIPLL